MKRWKLGWLIPLIVVIGATSFWFGWIAHRGSGDRERLTQLEQENEQLRSALEKLRSADKTQREQPGVADIPKDGPPAAAPHKPVPSSIEDSETLRFLRESLASAHKTTEELQSRLTDLQNQLEQTRQEQKRLTAAETVLAEQVASAKRLAEAKDGDLSRKNEQLLQLEASNKKLRDDAAAAGTNATQLLQTTNELQEVYRRRESYLNSLISRYREINEQYRAFTSVLENRRGPEGTPGTSVSIAGPELARIQTSMTMAEEDLRQLTTLNAQAQRIQKKLTGK